MPPQLEKQPARSGHTWGLAAIGAILAIDWSLDRWLKKTPEL